MTQTLYRPITGLFELANPVFGFVDGLFFFLPPFLHLMIWGVGAGALSMWLYGKVSPQGKLDALVDETRVLRDTLQGTEDNAAVTARDLWLRFAQVSLARVGVTLLPAVLSSLPVLFLLGFLNASYGLQVPKAGEPVALLLEDAAALQVEGGQRFASGWTFAWPQEGESVSVLTAGGAPLFAITGTTRIGRVAVPDLSARLFGAVGRLPASSPVAEFELSTLPQALILPQVVFPFQWMIPFFLAVVASSLTLKSVLRLS